MLAAIRTLQRLECVLDTMHLALNQLAGADSAWVQQHIPLDWYARYGLRAEGSRLPKDASKREALAARIGADGYQLMRLVFAEKGCPSFVRCPRSISSAKFGSSNFTMG